MSYSQEVWWFGILPVYTHQINSGKLQVQYGTNIISLFDEYRWLSWMHTQENLLHKTVKIILHECFYL